MEGGNPWNPGDAPLVEWRWIAGDYFKTMGNQLLQGRLFDDRDEPGSPQAIVINKSMAAKFWPGKDPIGKRVSTGGDNWLEVVGVITDVRSYGLAARTPYEMTRTIEQSPAGAMTIVVRTAADDPAQVVQSARRIVSTLDPTLPISQVQTMEQVVAASIGQPRLLSALKSLFGALAALLAWSVCTA